MRKAAAGTRKTFRWPRSIAWRSVETQKRSAQYVLEASRMKPYSNSELETMLADLESDRVERKASFKGTAPSTVREAVCAFANDLSGRGVPGVVFIGAHDDGTPVGGFLGLLVIGKSPSTWLAGAYTQFLRLAGADLTAPVTDEELIYGTVADQIRRLEEKLETHNQRSVRFADVAQETLSETYSMDGLRQLVRNAIMHRSFDATNAPLRVYWFDDRIEIHNPGGPFGCVTLENFGQPGIADYRNPNLAEALRALGFVQRFGAGIAIARKAFGDRLRFELQPGFVAAIVSKGTAHP
jgi:predicted HTH transcriptional regulator